MTTLTLGEGTSPLGDLRWAVRDGRLCALTFAERWPAEVRRLTRRFGGFAAVAAHGTSDLTRRLADYFAGEVRSIEAVNVDPGGTSFQAAVWQALRTVPVGTTTTYAGLARAIGRPAAVRAVGAANAANPIWLVVPCHRAIGSDGRLVGYAGGLDRKRWLLQHEARFAGWMAPSYPSAMPD